MRDDHQDKLDFAAQLLRTNGDAFKAACTIAPDTGLALQIACKWISDPIVKAEQERLLSTTGAEGFLPTKELQARDVYAIATDPNKEPEDRLKAHRLFAEMMGYIVKEVPTSQTNILNQGVLVIREAPSDEAWEAKAARQQRALTGHAISVN